MSRKWTPQHIVAKNKN